MADITIKVIEPAASIDLCTLDELKTMLDISSTDEDEMLALWITQYSDVIATMCNRVFAKEKVQETWRGDLEPYDTERGRIFLTHYPVKDEDVEVVYAPTAYPNPDTVRASRRSDELMQHTAPVEAPYYELENRSGKMQFFQSWSAPIRVTYTGGYLLPDEAPPALKQALALMVSAARMSQQRELTSGIRSISHRESRVMFFDVNQAMAKGGASGPLGAAADTVNALLYHYMRFYV
jgi:hypothetical protein